MGIPINDELAEVGMLDLAHAMIDIPRLHETFLADLVSYAESRKRDVARGAETSVLAALLVQKYGYGVAKALRLVADVAGRPAPDLMGDVDRLVAAIDPDWRANQERRFQSRPAELKFT